MTPESEEEIRFPVKPVIEQGPVEIQFYIASQAGRQLLSHTVYVMVGLYCFTFLQSGFKNNNIDESFILWF